jgi:hypothetical protein
MAEKVRRVLRSARSAYSIGEIALRTGLSPYHTARVLRGMKREVIYCTREDCSVIVPDEVYPRGERRFYALRERREYLDRKIKELERKSRAYFSYARNECIRIKNKVRRVLPKEERKF